MLGHQMTRSPRARFRAPVTPTPFALNCSLNCSSLFGAGCSLETAASSGPGARFLCFALGPK